MELLLVLPKIQMRFVLVWRGGQGSLGSFQVLASCSLRSFGESRLLRQTLYTQRLAFVFKTQMVACFKKKITKQKSSNVFYKTHDQIPKVTENKENLRNFNR